MSQSIQIADNSESNGIEPSGLSTDEAFETLSNHRRRCVVHFLLQQEDTANLRELSRHVAAWENDKPIDRVTPEERRRVYNALQQFHLPKMDGHGIVDYESNRGTVEETELTAELQLYQDAESEKEELWCAYGFLLGVAGGGVVGGALARTMAVGPGTAVALVALFTLLSVPAVVHIYRRRRRRLGCAGPPPECDRKKTASDQCSNP